mgnify:CR=1 FL=1
MAINSSIQALIAGEQVAGSRFSGKLLDELMAEGLLSVSVHGSRKSYRAIDPEALRRYLVDKDECYRLLEVNASDSRASMAAGTGNSKLLSVRSCPGFPINSYEPIECMLNGKSFVVNPQEGSFVFIDNWQQFVIPEDVIVVGIENMENFRMIRRQRQLFEKEFDMASLLFVSRYPQSTDLRQWLLSIPNRYVHFGDFDLAGIHIFLTEFYQYLGIRSSFLIPDDIKERIANHGNSSLFYSQEEKCKNIKVSDNRVQPLVEIINKYHMGYEQEGYAI